MREPDATTNLRRSSALWAGYGELAAAAGSRHGTDQQIKSHGPPATTPALLRMMGRRHLDETSWKRLCR